MAKDTYYATGKRKTAVARVWLLPGSGSIQINNKGCQEYFSSELAEGAIVKPLMITNTQGKFDIKATVRGGGVSAQAEAIRHGIARALLLVNAEYRLPLKKAGFLTRDPRVKERKKYGLAAARKRFQYSKR